ncbi:MAG: DUF4430 domain-containing protein [Eggerthellaceae bacterium]|nr:DUF4430 domain-containing protein [Eggerthellaceae bacterium]
MLGAPAADSSASGAASSAADAASSAAATEGTIGYSLKIDASAVDKGVLYDDANTAAEGTTVYDALIATGLDLDVKQNGGMTYVDGIDGVVGSEVSPTSGWMYSINGESPDDSADQHKIADGDTIEWTFFKG